MTEALREVRLYGKLGQLFGRVHHFAVASPAEAVRALIANFPTFERHVIDSGEQGVGYLVRVGTMPVGKEDLHHTASMDRAIRIAPVPAGRGKGWGQILLGVVLIVASFFVPVGYAFAGSLLFGAGVSLALGGVTQLLSPPPRGADPDEPFERKPSYLFDGAVNAVVQGHPVPILYGEMVVGSVVVSVGVTAA